MRLTEARADGIRAIALQGEARVSNVTKLDPASSDEPTVYWQTAAWLLTEGFASSHCRRDGEHLRLTPAGIRQANILGEQLRLL